MSSIALVDCNNFFASCEKVFNPKLRHKPLVVLSSNDGCIIARSSEAKALGIPMGAPFFEWADFIKAHDVAVCSSNFALYGDFSSRVMRICERLNSDLEIYSIDEAFLDVSRVHNPLHHCLELRKTILQWTGIPVSIGIASTKTLAKVATRLAKKQKEGVFFPSAAEMGGILETLPTQEIWGIGRRLSTFLAKRGIHTAAHLLRCSEMWIKQNLSVVGLRTVWELRGISCFVIDEEPPAKQSIMTSRSFGRPILSKEELGEALSSFATRAGEKLRQEGSLASWIQVFIWGKEEGRQVHLTLPEPTQYTPTLIAYAKEGLEALYRPGIAYKKGGVLLGGLVPQECYQPDLFVDSSVSPKQRAAMELLDRANQKFGYRVLHFAAEGITKSWQTKRQLRSPSFTTRWDEILTIRI